MKIVTDGLYKVEVREPDNNSDMWVYTLYRNGEKIRSTRKARYPGMSYAYDIIDFYKLERKLNHLTD